MRSAIKVDRTLDNLIVDSLNQLYMNNLVVNQRSLLKEVQWLNAGISDTTLTVNPHVLEPRNLGMKYL